MTRPNHLPPVKRVGHKGADTVVPGNTLASFRAALEAGVDMIEFDVLRLRDGRLVLAHDYDDAGGREPITLEEGLDHFAGEAYAEIELDVDMKLPGYEREVVEGLVRRGLEGRTLVSSTYLESLDRIGELAPGTRRGWSIPRARRDYTRTLLAPGAYVLLRILRARLPRRARAAIEAGRCEAVMAHWLLTSERLVSAVQGAGGQLYAWTVDDPRRIARLDALGLDGVITNDPRLFASGRMSGSDIGGRAMGLLDKIRARSKKAAGELADDASLKREGRRDERKAEAEEELARAQDEAAEKAQEVSRLDREP
jgi:glycerophosphoryl diester phosphodiesterase